MKGRVIRVRFAAHGAAIKIKYLAPSISNEMLEQAFGQFGPVERAVVFVDERGKSLGEGLVEFQRKPSAQMSFRYKEIDLFRQKRKRYECTLF